VPLFNVGAVWPMARHGQRGLARELVRNPLIIATASGLGCNLLSLSMPEGLVPTAERIGQASLALGLMTAGAGMQLGRMAQAKTLAALLLGLKHLALPLAAWGMARLWGLEPTAALVLLMFSAVPTASSCYVLAARMGYDGPYVAGLVTLSTLLGMASLTFALGWLAGL
jgi:malonate transporter and related proteins